MLDYDYTKLQHIILSSVIKTTFIYGNADDLTIMSRSFLDRNNINYKKIIGGDHLFTNATQIEKLIELVGEVFDNENSSLS